MDPATAERIERRHTASRKRPWSPTDHVVFPPETLCRFATDPDPKMRALALRDPELPAGLAERLSADGCPERDDPHSRAGRLGRSQAWIHTSRPRSHGIVVAGTVRPCAVTTDAPVAPVAIRWPGFSVNRSLA
jgi:hypothetical protein